AVVVLALQVGPVDRDVLTGPGDVDDASRRPGSIRPESQIRSGIAIRACARRELRVWSKRKRLRLRTPDCWRAVIRNCAPVEGTGVGGRPGF
ncbi:hypothetical protein AB0I53_48680, partial [Saccharopolyspora sp. NPDC050389]|uniref:hypothetical protein n=1 Tax=Saccharopolyspora sp. NPDC050389 TaxID=3155516 RepID=UPI0033C8D236